MKKNGLMGLIISTSILLVGCSSFTVTKPDPTDQVEQVNGFSRDPTTDHLIMKIEFSQQVDPKTVTIHKTLILKFAKDPNAGAQLNWTDTQHLTITTDLPVDQLMTFTPDGGWTLTIIGTDKGDGIVKDLNGKVLDGDKDGTDGGDYIMGYRIIG
jgi:hypothetical protein